ncbi:MAG: NeuD/PglB/VioB family sugar acetyltransferase [Colwellia sp.]|jgi:sugar O-acyltransferase, sialic acid O-acetyltransferase NeuD family
MEHKLILLGGGGHCKACIDVIEQEGKYEIIGILDENNMVGQKVLGYEIFGRDNDIERLVKDGFHFLITVGQIKTSKLRQKLFDTLVRHGAVIASITSPRAYVSKHAYIDVGTIIMHDVLVNAGTKIGKNCIVNTKALLEHDVTIENHSHISTAAVVNGGVIVRKGTFFGSNAVSKEYVSTDSEDFIKAGSIFKGVD